MEDDGTYVRIGTVVEQPVEDEEISLKPVRVEDQTVKDAQGRRRFHGAFTGGFSAGYYNTVGTKEGWAPSTFKSSRSGGRVVQSVEDFMDEEDREDFGIAPKQVRTTAAFSAAAPKRPSAAAQSDSKALQYLDTLVQPARQDIGYRLLRAMGWREGQGVGERILPHRKSQRKPKSGSGGADNEEDDNANDEDAAHDFAARLGVTLAPRDVAVLEPRAKDNFHGLGYTGISAKDFNLDRGDRHGMGGIGVGVLEDEDEDIYDNDDKRVYDRVMEPEREFAPRPVFRGNLGHAGPQALTYRDDDDMAFGGASKYLIPGFKVGSVHQLPRTVYPPPPVPDTFVPFHKFDKPGPLSSQGLMTSAMAKELAQLSAKDRAIILGETQLTAPPEALAAASAAAAAGAAAANAAHAASRQPPAPPPAPPPGVKLPSFVSSGKPAAETIPGVVTDRSTPLTSQQQFAELQTSAFKPFKNDVAKQARYEAYLRGHRRSHRGGLRTREEEAELREFEQAARLYKPLTRVMAMRFQPASQTEEEAELLKQQNRIAAEPTPQQLQAVRTKQFGPLTRTALEWHPHRILCKRFGVADPYPESGVVGVVAPQIKRKSRWGDVSDVFKELDQAPAPPTQPTTSKTELQGLPENIVEDTANMVAQMKEEEELQPLPPRPPVDLFKAIFSGSESEDEAEEQEKEKEAPKAAGEREAPQEQQQPPTPLQPPTAPPAVPPAATSRLRRDSASSSSSSDVGPSFMEAAAEGLVATRKSPTSPSSSPSVSPAPPPTAQKGRPPAVSPQHKLTLVHQHPLASRDTAQVATTPHGELVVQVPRRAIDDDNDWVEAPVGDVGTSSRSPSHGRRHGRDRAHSHKKEKKDKKDKKDKKEKTDKKDRKDRRDRDRRRHERSRSRHSDSSSDSDHDGPSDAELLRRLRRAGGIAGLTAGKSNAEPSRLSRGSHHHHHHSSSSATAAPRDSRPLSPLRHAPPNAKPRPSAFDLDD